jgi:hypothetical protein
MKIILPGICLLMLCSAASAPPREKVFHAAGRASVYCPRKPVTFFKLAAELNAAQSPCQSRLDCARGQLGNTETKEIAGYALSNWLWSGPAPKTFTVAEQDQYVADGKARALNARPSSKMLVQVTFFTDFIVPTQGGAYFLGARALYGNCVGSGLGKARALH